MGTPIRRFPGPPILSPALSALGRAPGSLPPPPTLPCRGRRRSGRFVFNFVRCFRTFLDQKKNWLLYPTRLTSVLINYWL
jgi:hypothetical protein